MDLKTEVGVAENALKAISAEVKKAKDKVEEKNESWRLKQRLWADYYKVLRSETLASERVVFLKAKIDARLEDDRLKYNEAMNEGRTWPNPKEVVFYRRNKIHRALPQDWKRARPELEKLAKTMDDVSRAPAKAEH